jgi:hypothetical protein
MYSMFLRCARQFEYRYIEGRIDPPKGVLILGRGTHKGLEWAFTEHMERGKPPPVKKVEEATVAGIEDELKVVPPSEVEWKDGDSPGKVKDDGAKMVRVYEPIRTILKPRSVEKSFEVEFSNTDWKLTGRVDLETDAAVVDLKTTAKAQPENAAEMSEQLGVYNLQAPSAKSLELHVMVRTKEPKLQVLRSGPRTTEQRNEVLSNIAKVVTLIRAGIFPKAIEAAPGSPCSWCGYYEACRGKKRKTKDGA